MAQAPGMINSLLIPLAAQRLLVPQAAVAEVVAPEALRELPGSASWLAGVFDWRSEQIPVVSIEAMCDPERGAAGERPSRYVVLYGVEGFAGLAFYAVEAFGIPRSMRIQPDGLLRGEVGEFDCDLVASHVLAEGDPAFIPETGVIERAIRAQLQRL